MPDKKNNMQATATDSCHIYIVDDNEQQTQLMQAMAATANITTLTYNSSINFLAAPLKQHDIVVLDLQMPEKDGIEIMRELAAKNIKPNFILVSGFDERVLHSARQLAESKHLNVIATLTKPIKAKNFITLLTETLDQCKQQHAEDIQNHSSTELNSNNTKSFTIDELKLAIRKHQLAVYFQPKINFKDKKLMGAEVLVRWLHPEYGLIMPAQFIPLAEQHQLMNLLTEEILKLVMKEYKKLNSAGLHIKVAINLSAQNITDLAMPEKLEALIKSNAINPESFTFEMTESSLMNEISDSLDILNRLRMKGFSLSVDDFGMGYSSLVKLYQAPFSELKIDRHFITRMTTDPDAAAIVKICILLAKELNVQVVAEGVETEDIWDALKKLDCDQAQGYFIVKPQAVDQFIDWVNQQSTN